MGLRLFKMPQVHTEEKAIKKNRLLLRFMQTKSETRTPENERSTRGNLTMTNAQKIVSSLAVSFAYVLVRVTQGEPIKIGFFIGIFIGVVVFSLIWGEMSLGLYLWAWDRQAKKWGEDRE